jgi:pimeloyl-ACP methyl ester carboxylesterase
LTPAIRRAEGLASAFAVGDTRAMDVAFRTIAGVRTRVLTVHGSGPPILLLHGFSDHAAGWRPFLLELEAQGRAAVALDLPGFGRADRLEPGPVLPQLAGFAREAVRLVAAEQGSPLVVGNSLGGAAAWAAAQESRLPLAGIVAIAPAGFGFTRPLRLARRILSTVPGGLPVPPLPMPVLRFVLVHGYARGSGAGRHLDPSVGRSWVGQFARRSDVRATADLLGRIVEEIDEVRALPVPAYPVLLVWGKRDRLVRPDRSFEGADSISVENWGHCPQLMHPDLLAELVLEFGGRLPAGRARSA